MLAEGSDDGILVLRSADIGLERHFKTQNLRGWDTACILVGLGEAGGFGI